MLIKQSRKTVSTQQQQASSHTIKLISEKWRRIVKEIDQQKAERHLELQSQMELLEKKALTANKVDFKTLQYSINTLNQQVSDYLTEQYNEKTSNSFSNAKQNFEKSLQQQKQDTSDQEQRLLQQLEWSNIQDQMARNESQYGYHFQRKLSQISNSIDQIDDILRQERDQRIQSFEEIEYDLEEKLYQLQNFITLESQVRRQTEGKIFDMINDVHQDLQEMLQDEKKQRQIMTNNLMQLMDDACIRIDNNLNSF